MLDLKNITDEEFSILVTPSAPQAAMYSFLQCLQSLPEYL